jgi:quinol monooxygenase YgiN
MQAKVAVLGTLRFPPQNMPMIRPHLQVLVQTTRQQDGCVAYDVAEDCFDPGLVRFSELWPDHESLTRHLNAPHIAPWRAAATAGGLLDRTFATYDITAGGPV